MKSLLCFIFLFLSSTGFCQGASRDYLFSMTPEQMIFASKLTDSYRRVYCNKFSLLQRQQALEMWKSKQTCLSDEKVFTPNDFVKQMVNYSSLKERACP